MKLHELHVVAVGGATGGAAAALLFSVHWRLRELGAHRARVSPPGTACFMCVATTASRLGAMAEITSPFGRWLRDRVLMPLLSRFAGSDARGDLLQERTDTLLAIGRA